MRADFWAASLWESRSHWSGSLWERLFSPRCSQESAEKLSLLQDMIEENYYYVDDVTQEMLRDGVYKGLVSSLGDPYSEYYNEADMEELEEQLSGYFFGIGAYLTKQEDAAVISGVIRGTPAEESGLMPGDIIMKVDDVRVTYEMSLDEVVAMVRGPEGTVVHLTVYRESEGKDLEFDVTRAQISSETVYSEMLDGDIGLIVVDRFEEVTSGQFKDALEDLKKQGMKALVIDLRYNPGGQVTTVTEIASELLPEGLVFYTEDKSGARTEYTCPGVDFGYPLAVLVNEYSASASEILAGAIQDAEIGTIVGTQTFGKGVVQFSIPCSVRSKAVSSPRKALCLSRSRLSKLMPMAAAPLAFSARTISGVSNMPLVPKTGRNPFEEA